MAVGRYRTRESFVIALWLLALGACQGETPQPAQERTAVVRPLGTWHGRGSQTIGVVSESGRLHVTWQTSNASPSGSGQFRLALHSAVSGRPLQLLVDQRGEARGSADVADDPRAYNFMVDSADVDWSFTVEEIVGVVGSARERRPSS
jgi:hypothetical protein